MQSCDACFRTTTQNYSYVQERKKRKKTSTLKFVSYIILLPSSSSSSAISSVSVIYTLWSKPANFCIRQLSPSPPATTSSFSPSLAPSLVPPPASLRPLPSSPSFISPKNSRQGILCTHSSLKMCSDGTPTQYCN